MEFQKPCGFSLERQNDFTFPLVAFTISYRLRALDVCGPAKFHSMNSLAQLNRSMSDGGIKFDPILFLDSWIICLEGPISA